MRIKKLIFFSIILLVCIAIIIFFVVSTNGIKPQESKKSTQNKQSSIAKREEKLLNESGAEPGGIDPNLNNTKYNKTENKIKWTPPRSKTRLVDRNAMLNDIMHYGFRDKAVLKAMASVPRHEFVPQRLSSKAYNDTPLPIGYGQTISQPFIVAEMTRLLKLNPDSKVLEIGTGSGYQAAVLTEFTPYVYTIEIIKPLADQARERFGRLGYNIVQVKHGDGYYGWPEESPFDAIIVTAAAGEIPPPLIKQLKNGGRMVIPVGSAFTTQSLMLVEKDEKGRIKTHNLMAVRFVPLVRKDKT